MTTITKEQFDIAMRIINITAAYGLVSGIDADDQSFEIYKSFNFDIDKMEQILEEENEW